MIIQEEKVELSTQSGPMLAYVYRPVAPGKYPGLLLFSEIFQQTGPIKRTAMLFAGHGYVVAVPEIFHELEAPGCVLAYDQAGADRGNSNKIGKSVAAYDNDATAVISFLKSSEHCTGKLGSIGICIGGHLSFRAAMHRDISAAVCFYATDIHKGSLGAGGDDSLSRVPEISAELMMIWGKQDPHVPADGRALIYKKLSEAGTLFTWHEFNGQHAFLRDEGARYDPELALRCYQMSLGLFARKLGQGDLPAAESVGKVESRH